MADKKLKLCPIGIQTFENIIEDGYLYIDKTEYVYNLANGAGKYFFLSRRDGSANHCLPPHSKAISRKERTL